MVRSELESIIRTAVVAGKLASARMVKNAFRATEQRLGAIPDLRAKLKADKEELEDIKLHGLKCSTTHFGVRPTLEAVTVDLEASIAATRHELEALEKALTSIETDPYYLSVAGKYVERMTDGEIAKKISCDQTTVWGNRKRLVQRVAVRLYGVEAVK